MGFRTGDSFIPFQILYEASELRYRLTNLTDFQSWFWDVYYLKYGW
jgi:hypothetical protein